MAHGHANASASADVHHGCVPSLGPSRKKTPKGTRNGRERKKTKKNGRRTGIPFCCLTSGAGGIKSADSKRDTSKMIIPIRCFTCGKVRACSLAAHPAR